MNKILKPTLIAFASLCITITYVQSSTHAYSSDKGAPLHQKYKKGDLNPYWFQESDSKRGYDNLHTKNAKEEINAYAFDNNTKGAKLYSEFKDGDFNPYWFQEQAAAVKKVTLKVK